MALELYEHNLKAFMNVDQELSSSNIASIIHATGTGKSYVALQLAHKYRNQKVLYVVPNKSIKEHLEEIIKNNNMTMEEDFPNLIIKTYQGLVRLNDVELDALQIELLILDEFHHIGAPIWGAKVDNYIKNHPQMKVFGMTAYTVRDRGTQFERDMVNPENDELFSNTIVSSYDLCDAMIDGILPKPMYKSAYVTFNEELNYIKKKIGKYNYKKEYREILKDINRRIHEAKGIQDLIKDNIKKDGKYIYFCPVHGELNRNDITTIMEEVSGWLKNIGIDNYEFYLTTSSMGLDGKNNRDAFYHDLDLNGNSTKNKLRIMFAINQYNEGVHAPGLDGVIMGRGTASDIVFFEQLGRALSVGSNTKEEYQKLVLLSKEELYQKCLDRGLVVDKELSKNMLIEKLLSPLIIDLTNNIAYIKELEDNLKNKVKEKYNTSDGSKTMFLGSTSFDIDLINEDLFQILQNIKKKFNLTWDQKYDLAKEYYHHYGHLKVPSSFYTNDGINYSVTGFKLGEWIINQRDYYKDMKLPQEKIDLLNEIGMIWNILENDWEEAYLLAEQFYKHYHHLQVPFKFKTKDGINQCEEGFNLNFWISNQRKNYRLGKLPQSKLERLENIGMLWNVLDYQFNKMYALAKTYYQTYGDLDIKSSFKTKDGINYDSNGESLGYWISNIRERGKINKLDLERIKLLNDIGMIWNILEYRWDKMYKLLENYYNHYGNINMTYSFKTNDGINYDEDGLMLGNWLQRQIESYNHLSTGVISEEQIARLNKFGINWEIKYRDEEWLKNYKLAQLYYNHYGNLEIDRFFKTKDGINYDEDGFGLGNWVLRQRYAYKGLYNITITPERIDLLNQIEMDWEGNSNDKLWTLKYEYAKIFYDTYKHLNIPKDYVYKDVKLGSWIFRQRVLNNCKKLEKEKIDLLNEIGMIWSMEEYYWYNSYNLCLAYYEHYGHTNIPTSFKTMDGINYVEDGITIGSWLSKQKGKYRKDKSCFSKEQLECLSKLDIDFDEPTHDELWHIKYELVKKYYEHYGNINISVSFKTNDGINYAEDGYTIGYWLLRQKEHYNKIGSRNCLSQDKIDKLNALNMNWELRNNEDLWTKKYELAKKYYEYHGNLEIPNHFKTKDGINYDSNGYGLSNWINAQRSSYYGKNSIPMTEERKKLLDEIGMNWELKDTEKIWFERFEVFKNYVEHYKTISVSEKFTTINGIDEDERGFVLHTWLANQKRAYTTGRLSLEKIKALESVGFKFISDKLDLKLQQEIIDDKNISKKQKELLSRLYSVLSFYEELPDNDELNKTFIKKLNYKTPN